MKKGDNLSNLLGSFTHSQDKLLTQHFQEEGQRSRTELFSLMKQNREELQQSLQTMSESTLKHVTDLSALQQQQWQQFSKQLNTANQNNETRFETLRGTVEKQLAAIQADNQTKLEQMRATVDEKLHATLEKRLGDSFKLVSERLEMVHKGLGDMQTLASGVGDLKKVLTNVKTRGMWGEVQLSQLLDQILTPDQYDTHVRTKPGSADHVEFAIKFPGREDDPSVFVWLPIDAKFPQDIHNCLDSRSTASLSA
jgi:DNA recombination protein RmuC